MSKLELLNLKDKSSPAHYLHNHRMVTAEKEDFCPMIPCSLSVRAVN